MKCKTSTMLMVLTVLIQTKETMAGPDVATTYPTKADSLNLEQTTSSSGVRGENSSNGLTLKRITENLPDKTVKSEHKSPYTDPSTDATNAEHYTPSPRNVTDSHKTTASANLNDITDLTEGPQRSLDYSSTKQMNTLNLYVTDSSGSVTESQITVKNEAQTKDTPRNISTPPGQQSNDSIDGRVISSVCGDGSYAVPAPQCFGQCTKEWLEDMYEFRTFYSSASPRGFTLSVQRDYLQSEDLCFCDSMCLLLGDCCYNYFPEYFGTTNIREINRYVQDHLTDETLDPDLRLLLLYGRCVHVSDVLPSILMVAACPEQNQDPALREKCENRFNAAPFNIPVTHLWSRNIVFSNIFCSRCHGVSDRDVEFWEAKIVCQDSSGLKNMSEGLSGEVKSGWSSGCKTVVNGLPASVSGFSQSRAAYRKCSTKGKKETEMNRKVNYAVAPTSIEEELRYWCDMYIYPVKSKVKNVKYVNPHCYWLSKYEHSSNFEKSTAKPEDSTRFDNTILDLEDLYGASGQSNTTPDVHKQASARDDLECTVLLDELLISLPLPEISSITMLFDFLISKGHAPVQIKEPVLITQSENCASDEVFDRFLQKCHKIHCHTGMIFSNGSCRVDGDRVVDHKTQMLQNGSLRYRVMFIPKDSYLNVLYGRRSNTSFLRTVEDCLDLEKFENEFDEIVENMETKIISGSVLTDQLFANRENAQSVQNGENVNTSSLLHFGRIALRGEPANYSKNDTETQPEEQRQDPVTQIFDRPDDASNRDNPVHINSTPAVEVSFASLAPVDDVFRIATILASQYRSCKHATPAETYLTNVDGTEILRCPFGHEMVLADVPVMSTDEAIMLVVVYNGSQTYYDVSYVPFLQKLTGLIPETVDYAAVCVAPDCVLVRYPAADVAHLVNKIRSLAAELKVNHEYLWEDNDTIYVCVGHAHTLRHECINCEFTVLKQQITSIGILCSNICLAVTLIVYATLKPLRNQHGQKIMCLSATLFVAEALFWFSAKAEGFRCQFVGMLQHFFWLSTFLWVSVVSFDFACTFVKATPSASSSLKCCSARLAKEAITCICIPCLIVLGFVAVHVRPDLQEYVAYGKTPIEGCWMKTAFGLFVGFFLPVGISLLFNLGCFIVTLVSIERHRLHKGKWRQDGRNSEKVNGASRGSCFHGVLYFKMSLIMGLPWLLSYIAGTVQLQWLLVLVAAFDSLQGVVVFLVFVCNRNVYNAARNRLVQSGKCRGCRVRKRSMYKLEFQERPRQHKL